MKIGVLIDRLNVGGVEKIAIEEVKALRKSGENAFLVVLREKAVVANAFSDLLRDVPVVYLDRRLPKLLRFSFRFPGFHFFSSFHLTYPIFLPFVIRKNEFDYLIVHGTYTSLSAIAIKNRKGIRFSTFIWDPVSYILDRVYAKNFLAPIFWVFKKIAARLDTYIINRTEVVLAGGAAHNEFIHKLNPNKIIKVIYPSVHPIAKPLKKEGYILVVTAWKEGKNPEYILDVSRELPNTLIKMAGRWVDPAYRRAFEKLLKNTGLTDCIEVIGEVSESELTQLYSHAQVLLQTNDDKGFGMPALEAAGNGTTFVIPEGQGVCSLFTDKEDGYYTKEKDTATITSLLKALLNDPKLAADMGDSAWNKVRDYYSWGKHAKELMELINN